MLANLELLLVLQTESKLDKAYQSIVKVVEFEFVISWDAHFADQLVDLSC